MPVLAGRMKTTKYKVVYWISAGLTLTILSLLYFPQNMWRAISWDGHGDEVRGIGVGQTIWKSIYHGGLVEESMAVYQSSEVAHRDFQERLSDPKAMLESPKNNDYSPETNRRVVLQTKEGAVQIVKLDGRTIQSINASSLKMALAFEKAWLKLDLIRYSHN